MSVSIGDRVPSATLRRLGPNGPEEVSTDQLFADKKVVLFAVPGAFTPACSDTHLPGFVEKAEDIKSQDIDEIVCVAVNDPFVMNAWSKAAGVHDQVEMLSDGAGEFTQAMGLTADMKKVGLGMRSQRYAAIVEKGVIQDLAVDEMGELEKSTAAQVLKKLKSS